MLRQAGPVSLRLLLNSLQKMERHDLLRRVAWRDCIGEGEIEGAGFIYCEYFNLIRCKTNLLETLHVAFCSEEMNREEQNTEPRLQGAALSAEGDGQLPPSHACSVLLTFAGAVKEFALRVGPVGGEGKVRGNAFKDSFFANYRVLLVKLLNF